MLTLKFPFKDAVELLFSTEALTVLHSEPHVLGIFSRILYSSLIEKRLTDAKFIWNMPRNMPIHACVLACARL